MTRLLPALAFVSLGGVSSAAAQCPEWSSEFHPNGPDGEVLAQFRYNSPLGEVLIVGGDFDVAGEALARNVAAWDGTSWSAFGSGAPGVVLALTVYDNGAGPALYAAGDQFLSRFDGSNWVTSSVLGSVRALHVYDDGSGPALFAAGVNFRGIAGVTVRGIARFDGTWTNVAGGLTGFPSDAYALETHDDGSGPALYVGGYFNAAGGVAARNIARWNGSSYAPLGQGVVAGSGFGPGVFALRSMTPTGGIPELHVGGVFDAAGGVPSSNWVKWSQSAWTDVGGDVLWVWDLAVREEAGGPVMIAARLDSVERYDGTSRTVLPFNGLDFRRPRSICSFGSTVPETVFVGLERDAIQGTLLGWDGAAWSPTVEGLGLGGWVLGMTVFDFGTGPELVIGGQKEAPWSVGARALARFDGTRWAPVGGPEVDDNSPSPSRFAVHQGELYTLGLSLNGTQNTLCRFDGVAWRPAGPLVGGSGPTSLVSFNPGTGSELIVAGRFDGLGVPGTHSIGRWDGTHWTSVGGGLDDTGTFVRIATVETWDDGTGEALYAGGNFVSVGGTSALNIARWDGSTWAPLGGGISGLPNLASSYINDMVVYDSPTAGEQLIVTGIFSDADGTLANSIAAWNGTSWSALGSGLGGTGLSQARRLAIHDPDGHGERLYVVGDFETAGGLPALGMAAWDGANWTAVGDFPFFSLYSLEEYDDGNGRALYVGGTFTSAGGVPASRIARIVDPCGDIVGTPQCTSLQNSTGAPGLLRASGSTSISADDLTLVMRNVPANVLTLLVNGTVENVGAAGDGLLCIGGQLSRMYPAGVSNAAGVSTQPFDYGAPYALFAVAGRTLYLQGWFRDAAGGPFGFNTTDALEVLFRP